MRSHEYQCKSKYCWLPSINIVLFCDLSLRLSSIQISLDQAIQLVYSIRCWVCKCGVKPKCDQVKCHRFWRRRWHRIVAITNWHFPQWRFFCLYLPLSAHFIFRLMIIPSDGNHRAVIAVSMQSIVNIEWDTHDTNPDWQFIVWSFGRLDQENNDQCIVAYGVICLYVCVRIKWLCRISRNGHMAPDR